MIRYNYKTTNGYDYDENGMSLSDWLNRERRGYKGDKKNDITDEHIKLLEDIGMVWLSDSTDRKLQAEEITEKNNKKKQKEIINRTYSFLNKFDPNSIPSKDELNSMLQDEDISGIKNTNSKSIK